MAQRRVPWWLVWASGLACGFEPPVGNAALVAVEGAPNTASDEVSVGVRFRIAAGSPLPRLYEGELSPQQRTRALADELPRSLEQRLMRWLIQPLETNELLLVPDRLLDPDSVYTLLSPGLVQVFRTRNGEVVARRAWPREGRSGMAALYCFADRHLAREPVDLALGVTGRWSDIRDDGCQVLELESPAPAQGVVSPMMRAEWILPPVWFQASADRLPMATCSEPGFTSIEFACLRVLDDRVYLRVPEQATLWSMQGAFSGVVPLDAGEVGAVKGLTPGHRHMLDWVVYPQRGGRARVQFELLSAAAQPHVVLNEVLANPNGAEPDQEWVELFNDGTRPVKLSGWKLLDSGGETPLPDVNLLPENYALIINETFEPNSAVDVVPEANVLMVEVSRLGKSGLSNAGEALRLVDKDGMVRSSFPPTPKPLAGVSIARRYPWATDGEAASFGVHAPPGASPGGRNVLADSLEEGQEGVP